jgi:hypothetical protein
MKRYEEIMPGVFQILPRPSSPEEREATKTAFQRIEEAYAQYYRRNGEGQDREPVLNR